MTTAELRAACERALEMGGWVQLILPRAMPRHSNRLRLAGRRGPTGTAIGEIGPKRLLADFCASEVLAWLDKEESVVFEVPRAPKGGH